MGLVVVSLLVLAAGRSGHGVSLTVVDDWLLERLAALRTPALVRVMLAVSALLGTIWTIKVLAWTTLIVLVATRRFRHLLVAVVSVQVASLATIGLSAAVRRPRPFGVAIEGSWAGWAMPSRPVAYLAAILVAMLYSLVPKGHWRQTGKWVATGLVTLLGLARMYLGVDAPSDVLVGAAIGVTFPLLAFRWFVPSDVFPVRYHRGRSAHSVPGATRAPGPPPRCWSPACGTASSSSACPCWPWPWSRCKATRLGHGSPPPWPASGGWSPRWWCSP